MADCQDRRVTRVVRMVTKDLTRRHTLASAAAVAGLDQAYFSKLFRRTTGQTFVQWNARVRVAEAKVQLLIVDLSITAIAISVGYADVTTFERAFHRIERMSPRAYRAQKQRGSSGKTKNAEFSTRNAESTTRNAETDRDLGPMLDEAPATH
jgi:AraC-like DNA-binding protein